MKIYYKDGFYFEGININIPSDAVEITEEYHQQLLNDMSLGRVIVVDDNGYPYSIIKEQTLEEWKEEKIAEVEADFHYIVSEHPLQYTNGLYYLPEYANVYTNLLPKYYDDKQTMKIWDASGKEENAVDMTKNELNELTKFLTAEYEKAYQDKKVKISKINACTEIDNNI